jgi:hypothetical protein
MAHWLRTDKARRFLFWSAWIVVCFGVLVVFALTPLYREVEEMPHALLLVRVLGGAVGVFGLPATLLLLVGMAVFCVKEDRSRFSVKLSWFILFFMIAPFGSAIYYFVVYRKLVKGKPPGTA